MLSLNLKRSLIVLIIAIPFIAGFAAYKHFSDRANVTVFYKNSHDVAIYDASLTQGDGNKKLVSKMSSSGETKKLKKERSYVVSYIGNTGFASGEIKIDLKGGNKEINLDPYYSEERLGSILDTKIEEIHKSLRDSYKYISLYKIQRGKLYHTGDWYGTTLKYVGSNNFQDDTIRVVLHIEGGAWKVKTDPPDITLSKIIYKDVPEDILRDVNNNL